MKIKLDENLPSQAAKRLRELGHEVDTVLEEGLGGQSDAMVWEAARSEGRFLITQDLDFSDTRRFVPGSHAGIMLVRLDDREQRQAADFLGAWFSMEQTEDWAGALVVASPRKIRILRPGTAPMDGAHAKEVQAGES
jgi:predicted nuclease of predicted toxin-antitoxin system